MKQTNKTNQNEKRQFNLEYADVCHTSNEALCWYNNFEIDLVDPDITPHNLTSFTSYNISLDNLCS